MKLYLVKVNVTALEIPLNGSLIIKYVTKTNLETPIDWLNLDGPSILAMFITIIDIVKFDRAIGGGGDNCGESNEFLPFPSVGGKYEVLTKMSYPGEGLYRKENWY